MAPPGLEGARSGAVCAAPQPVLVALAGRWGVAGGVRPAAAVGGAHVDVGSTVAVGAGAAGVGASLGHLQAAEAAVRDHVLAHRREVAEPGWLLQLLNCLSNGIDLPEATIGGYPGGTGGVAPSCCMGGAEGIGW